jgi:ABC-type sugar transport system ATPase subunit
MARAKLLQVEGVSKSFFGNEVLSSVDFELDYGEVLGLVGENGAGKSTLIKIITGVHQPDQGTIYVNGKPTSINDVAAARALGISVVFQELSLSPNLTVAENIFVGRMPRNTLGLLQRRRLYQTTQELIDRFRVPIKPTDVVGNLSIGSRQIVEILKAVALQPKLLILDEPTSSLEAEEIQELFKLIRILKANDYSIIYISHHLNEVFEIADKIMVLRDGRKVGVFDNREISMGDLVRHMINKDVKEFFAVDAIDKASSGEVLLELRNLSKTGSYSELSFSLYAGEILGLAGIVGCGKVEVCRTLFGILEPDSGEINLKGRKVLFASPSEAIQNKIMFLPESRKTEGLFVRDTVRQNLIAGVLYKVARSVFMSRKKVDALVRRFVDLLSIKITSTDQRVVYLSGGNQQKVLVSKCLAVEPEALIVVDPTRGIDIGSKAQIHRILHEIAAAGVGIILVSSELDEVIAMSDRIVVLAEGKISKVLTKREFDYQTISLAMHKGA